MWKHLQNIFRKNFTLLAMSIGFRWDKNSIPYPCELNLTVAIFLSLNKTLRTTIHNYHLVRCFLATSMSTLLWPCMYELSCSWLPCYNNLHENLSHTKHIFTNFHIIIKLIRSSSTFMTMRLKSFKNINAQNLWKTCQMHATNSYA